MGKKDKNKATEARDVYVNLNGKGQVKSVHDKTREAVTMGKVLPKKVTGKARPAKPNVPLDGEHFEWTLAEYERTGVPIGRLYAAQAEVALNDESVTDTNTLKVDLPKLVRLDCGLWGAYKYWREYQGQDGNPQRDFGLIESGHVWLAEYVSALNPRMKGKLSGITKSTVQQLGDRAPLARALAAIVGASGLGAIRLHSHAKADPSRTYPETEKNLYVCLPDLHLPERWPGIPDPKHRYGSQAEQMKQDRSIAEGRLEQTKTREQRCRESLKEMKAFGNEVASKELEEQLDEIKKDRKEFEKEIKRIDKDLGNLKSRALKVRLRLQKVLRYCQCRPGLIRGSTISKKQAARVQGYLEKLAKEGLLRDWVNGNRDPRSFNDDGTGGAKVEPFKLKVKTGKVKWREIDVEPQHFLAEMDVVDRTLRVHSTWFYGPGAAYCKSRFRSDGPRGVKAPLHHYAPQFGKKDRHETLLEIGTGDAGPGFDLVTLLAAVKLLRQCLADPGKFDPLSVPDRPKEANADEEVVKHVRHIHQLEYNSRRGYEPGDVKVRQLGDLLELWINLEFLYGGFWARDCYGLKGTKAKTWSGLNLVSSGTWTAFNYPDDFQERKGRLYQDPAAEAIDGYGPNPRRHARFYTFNPRPKKALSLRHVVGDMIKPRHYTGVGRTELEKRFGLPECELKRRQTLVKDRIDSVKRFSLPFPEMPESVKKALGPGPRNTLIGKYYRDLFGVYEPGEEGGTFTGRRFKYIRRWQSDGYLRRNDLGKQEVLWSKLILDLLHELECVAIYGNHDGYRGDPLLNVQVDGRDCESGWHSEKGLWFEHGHRWDEYNRDGCSFGSGMTNLVYYRKHTLCGRGGAVKGAVTRYLSEHQKFGQPGAAIWFLLVDLKDQLPWFIEQDGVRGLQPFGIYVCGHSHGADLVTLHFIPAGSKKKPKSKPDTEDGGGVQRRGEGRQQAVAKVKPGWLADTEAAEYHSYLQGSVTSGPMRWLKRPKAAR